MGRYLLLVVVYLISTTVPLFTEVGANLEYEYALMASYFALALIPLAALFTPAAWLPVEADRYEPPRAFEFFWILLLSPVLALLPAAAYFALNYCPCSRSGFAFWMALVWYPAWVLAHALYHGLARARLSGVPRWLAGLGVVAVVLGGLVLAGVDLWIYPQKRIVSLIAGFLHGPIYDEFINVDLGITMARAAHLALALTLLTFFWLRARAWPILSFITAAALYVGLALFAARFPSVQNGKPALDALLYGRLPGQGFTLHWLPESRDAPVPVAIDRLARDAQFHVDELTKILGEGGAPLPHVDIYVYPNDEKKKLWFGGGQTDVTDVRTPSIHITLGTWPHPTLRHELVHALASGFGYKGLGFHPNIAFTEGLAVALAPQSSSLSLDDGAASLISSGRLKDVGELFSPAFWRVEGSRAYTAAGSLINWLIAKKGFAGVRALYAGASWDEAFHDTEGHLVQEWKDDILKGYDKDKNGVIAEALFRQPGILSDVCPHSKADLSRPRKDVFVRTRQPLKWDPDTDYSRWLLTLDGEDKETRLNTWRHTIRALASERVPALGRLNTWREALEHARKFPPETLEDVEMGILESDLSRIVGDAADSKKILGGLVTESKAHFFGDSNLREITARVAVEKDLPDATALEWRRYLAGWRRAIPDPKMDGGPWILTYLKMRNEREVPQTSTELTTLLTDAKPDEALPETFRFEWYKILANRLMRSGAFNPAADAFDKAAEVSRASTHDLYAEHARRAHYYATRGPLTPSKTAAEDDTKDKSSH